MGWLLDLYRNAFGDPIGALAERNTELAADAAMPSLSALAPSPLGTAGSDPSPAVLSAAGDGPSPAGDETAAGSAPSVPGGGAEGAFPVLQLNADSFAGAVLHTSENRFCIWLRMPGGDEMLVTVPVWAGIDMVNKLSRLAPDGIRQRFGL